MTKSNYNEILTLCRERIAAANDAIETDPLFTDQLVRIVGENVSTGRYERVAAVRSKAHPNTLAQYIDNVIVHLRNENARISGLACGDANEWQQLNSFLVKRAGRMLSRFRQGSQVEAEAHDYAQDTCIVIFEERYPFDVPFEAWVTTILNRLILTNYTRSKDALNRPKAPNSLDKSSRPMHGRGDPLVELLRDPHSLERFEKIENQEELRNAIAKLRSSQQREVITSTYFGELDDAQIAKRLGKSKQAVYNLRSRALVRLKEIMADD